MELGYAGGRLLERLLLEPGAVVTREDLLEYAWPGRVVGQGSLNQQIYTLRQLFCDEKGREIIQTLPRRGYLFNPQFVEASPAPHLPDGAENDARGAREHAVSGAATRTSWLLGAAAFSVLMLAAVVLLLSNAGPDAPEPLESRITHGEVVLRLQASDSRGLAHLEEYGARLAARLAAFDRKTHDFIMRTDDSGYRLLCRSRNNGSARWLLIHASRLASLDDARLKECVS